jgi:hypothetical protein
MIGLFSVRLVKCKVDNRISVQTLKSRLSGKQGINFDIDYITDS